MPRKGRDFELSYQWLYNLDKNKYTVTSPAFIKSKITGRKREVDVLIEYNDEENNKRRIAVECRDRKSVEDSTWIEYLKTKREILELDYIIATTTRSFTKEAIETARYFGIIIEKAEMFNKKLLNDTTNEFVVDLFFLKFEFNYCNFIMNNGETKSLKQLIKELPLHHQLDLIKELNTGLYFSIDPHKIMDNNKFDKKKFFEETKENFIIFNINPILNDNAPTVMKEIGMRMANIEIKLIPFRVSLPLNKSLSVFEIEDKKNKKYNAIFGNEEEYVQCGYLDDGKIYYKIKFKERKYLRFVIAEMCINTIFPDTNKDMKFDIEKDMSSGIGSIDFSKVL